MATQIRADPPLDEQVFSAPSLLASWSSSGQVDSNNILFYFAHSPFFDRTSNNATLLNQAQYNPALGAIVSSRAAFEAHLRSMAGLEFVVGCDPTRSPNGHSNFHSSGIVAAGSTGGPAAGIGAWTIRKQIRRKAAGARGEDAVDVLAEYFVVGDRVFQAPALSAVLGARLLATAKALVGLVGSAADCAGFEPARGHVYPVSAAKAGDKLGGVASSSVAGSRGATPVVVVPEMAAGGGGGGGGGGGVDEDYDDYDARHEAALLAETFMNAARYGREYMDEHPLVGEPGNFIIQKSKELQVPVGAMGGTNERKGIVLPSLTVKTDLASAVNNKREKGGEKSPLSPTGTGATKKRKKDKLKAQTPKEPKTPGA